jgi:hypothetical protein
MTRDPLYFNPAVVSSEQEALSLWRRVHKGLHWTGSLAGFPHQIALKQAPTVFSYLVDHRGKLVRFWLRTAHGNQLVIVGNDDGLLPIDVEALHG